jgi:hypothetical protein
MENKLEIIQTETMMNIDFEGESYSVILTEDKNHESGYTSWEIYNDDGEDVSDIDLESKIIAYVIENMS